MSFSSEMKRELTAIRDMPPSQMSAALFGLFYAGRVADGRAVVQTESSELLSLAAFLAESVFPEGKLETTRLVKNDGSLFTFSIRCKRFKELFGDFSAIAPSIVAGDDSDAGAFLRGIFISCGSVTNPSREYHLEMVLPVGERVKPLQRFLEEHGIMIKSTLRGKTPVLYAKESELIEDFLTYIGAANHALEIMRVKVEKDFRNRVNRTVNCDNANLDRTVAASGKVRREIAEIERAAGLDSLPPELRETALLRISNPESSLSELCEMFNPPISRSGLNHRLKKLSQIAEKIRKGEDL